MLSTPRIPPLGSQARASLLAAINVNIAHLPFPFGSLGRAALCSRGHRPHSANVLAHLAAARTAGVRCAMKCLARPPLRQGAKDDAPHAMDKGYCAHLRQEGKAITNAHATKKPLPAGRGGRRMRGRFFTFSCPCRGRARPASPLRPALFYRRRRKCHRDRRSPSCRTCRARVRHAPVRAA